MSVFVNCAVLIVLLCFCGEWKSIDSFRILICAPTPTHSHQVPFQRLAQALLHRGHHVVLLTPDPVYQPSQAPQNFTEVDLHEVSHKYFTAGYKKALLKAGRPDDFSTQIKTAYDVMYDLFPKQIETKAVSDLLLDKTQKFDLVIVEAWVYQAIVFAHIYNAPAILMSTMGIVDEMYEDAGVPIHPIIYPDVCYTRRYDLSIVKRIKLLYNRVQMHFHQKLLIEKQTMRLREMFGAEMPSVREMTKRAMAQFVMLHSVWEGYRPQPLNIVHIGGLHVAPPKDLPEDLKTLMDSSKYGVIYMSFGSHMSPSFLPPERLDMFARVFSTLKYDVVLKWKGASPPSSSNVHSFAWLPQPDLLRHEKLLLFITQGGLQSTEEALCAGVPMLGIPLMTDQWLNVENYERLGIGLGLDLYTFTENQLRETIEILINDKSYRESSKRVGREIKDRPQTALDRAVWWAERAIRLRGRQFYTSPPSLTWDDILQTLLVAFIVLPLIFIFAAKLICRLINSLALKFVRMCKRLVGGAR